MTRAFGFDIRSARSPRASGWERYARELSFVLRDLPGIYAFGRPANVAVERPLTDVGAAFSARRYRVAHFPTYPPLPGARGQVATVFTLHDLTWWTHPETASRMGLTYFRPLAERAVQACHVVTHSSFIAGEAQSHFGLHRDNISVIHPGVDIRDSTGGRLPSHLQGRPYLLAVGTLEPRKNMHRLVEAHARSGLGDEVPLIIVGRRAWGEVPAGVSILSDLGDADLVALYQGATAVVVPSIYEGFGLPVLEALRLGTRVACSDIPIFREVSGGHAVFFDPLDVDAIAHTLLGLASTPVGASLDATGWARTFTWERAGRQLHGLYCRLAAAI